MKRRLPMIFVAVVTVICLVAASVAAVAAGAGGSAVAYSVNGTKVSQSTVDHQLEELADAKVTSKASATDGSVASSAAAQVLTLNIARDIMRDAAERRGVKVTDAQRASARDALGDQIQGYPERYVDLVVDLQAHATALGLSDDTAVNTFLAKQFSRADVSVDPRYGQWSPTQGVCPPTGCATAGAGG